MSLAGRDLKRAVATQVAADITGALRSAGLGARKFREHISRFEKSLSDLDVGPSGDAVPIAHAIALSLHYAAYPAGPFAIYSGQ